MDKKEYWYNFQTGEYDFVEAPTTDEEAVKYLPQLGAGLTLYSLYREQGLDIVESMKNVLEAALKTQA